MLYYLHQKYQETVFMISYFKDILSGRREITEYIRYELARIGIGVVHIALTILFFSCRCIPLAVFNCFSVLFYAVILEMLLRKEYYLAAFISTYLEIILHSFFATIMIGWKYGFSLYNIGLIYVAYYFAYISPTLKKKILVPSILGVINLTLTIAMRICSYIMGPLSRGHSDLLGFSISAINIFIAAVMIMFFATFHTIEIRRKEYELRTTNIKLDRLARYDALTKLRNRHSMEEEFHSLLDNTQEDYCFIMGDIDDFKQFNDQYGHACGDYVLKSVADIILKNTGKQNMACRWGGEEILILLRANIEYAHIIAEKIRYEIEHMNSIFQDEVINVTMTFGVAPYTPGNTFEKCISMADQYLYEGKQKGKNCVVTAPSETGAA